MPRNGSVTIQDARIIFRNFGGREDQYNDNGERSFAVVLSEEDANALYADGWNVKRTNPRDDEEVGIPYLKVAVSYKVMTPMIFMITSRGRTALKEDLVGMLDNVEISMADMIINPYRWEIGKGASAKSGTKAYLEALYVTIIEDELMAKYADIPDAGAAD